MKNILLAIAILLCAFSSSLACGVFGNIYGTAATPTSTGYQAIDQAQVSLSVDGLITRSVPTNAFGFYAFWGVPACDNYYAVSIEKKRFAFIAPVQFVALPIADSDNNVEVDFISN